MNKFLSLSFTPLAVTATVASIALSSGSAQAVTIGPPAAGEQSLQTILDNISSPGAITVQSDAEFFKPNSSNSATSSIVIEFAGNAANNVLGIYNSIGGTMVDIFGGGATQGSKVFLNFSGGNLGLFDINNNAIGNGTFNGFGTNFGFYLRGVDQQVLYSQSAENPNGFDAMAAFSGADNQTTLTLPPNNSSGTFDGGDWIFAWEDSYSGDGDYNDFVVHVSDIEAVPEPLTILGTGLALGLGGLFKSKQSKKQSLAA
ncbi:DUF4114 domain-containing protein [Cyanobacterium aponinum]|uniref:DUF4114 domain-containing protein n=1 Tax=Cyanobacterium aponinum TaxID=379064 RepID=UPI000C12B66E|nr:DUF4114 domain-containing protein [Cyanobacterium aponinum]PHV62596.1 hypothetical protein CSQ80_09905 [Cyanobacterium aponinum IPPAS B-1201]